MSEERVRQLIGALRDFRTRSAAADQLISAGRTAVQPLLDALEQESHEGARWAMLNCLGELRAAKAVPTIAAYLEQADYQTVAHEALVKIVGKDLGPLPAEWLRWAERQALETGKVLESVMDTEGPAPLSNDRLVELALEGGVGTYRQVDQNRYGVDLPLAGGRMREVAVVFGGHDHEGGEIVIVYSECGAARPEHYETVLRRNLRMPYGAIALRDIGGKPCFVMFNTILRHALSPVELRKSIFAIGERADRVERQLHQ
ncbi:MAG: HEAT repeat domain-containing protein [Planctomycetota bacterium]|jgi:hypothetical protein